MAGLAAALAAGLPVVGIQGDLNNKLLLTTPGVFLEDGFDLISLEKRLLALLTKTDYTNPEIITQFFQQVLSWENIVRQYVAVLN